MAPYGEVPASLAVGLERPAGIPMKHQKGGHQESPSRGMRSGRSTGCVEHEETYSSSGPDNRKSSSDGGISVENQRSEKSKVTEQEELDDLSGLGKRKRHHRHTQEQIEELERLFQANPHPDETQRLSLSRQLKLEPKQVKFWFQNRRTQMKAQTERSENAVLRSEVDALRRELGMLRDAMKTAHLLNNGSAPQAVPALPPKQAPEPDRQLGAENAQLKEQVKQLTEFVTRSLEQQQSAGKKQEEVETKAEKQDTHSKALDTAATALALAPPQHDPRQLSSLNAGLGPSSEALASAGLSLTPLATPTAIPRPPKFAAGLVADGSVTAIPTLQLTTQEKELVCETAMKSLEELLLLATCNQPLWANEGGREVLNKEEYQQRFPDSACLNRMISISECTRASGVVAMTAPALVEVCLDIQRWQDLFPCIIAKAAVLDVLSLGVGNGNRDGALLLMYCETHILSPLVATRSAYFLRYCKLLPDGSWAIVDASVDSLDNVQLPASAQVMSVRRPSGFLIKDLKNGCCRVTLVEHNVVQELPINRMYDEFVRCGAAFGALRWVATLQRQCVRLASQQGPICAKENCNISIYGRRSLFQLSRRMCVNFCLGASSYIHPGWTPISTPSGTGPSGLRILARKNSESGKEPAGMILAASTSIWLPVSPPRIFEFLKNLDLRSQWDILCNGGFVSEMGQLIKGQGPEEGNNIWLLKVEPPGPQPGNMLILQESATDCFGSILVYAPVDIPAMRLVMSGGNPEHVALLPSGFIVLPDGHPSASTMVGQGMDSWSEEDAPRKPGTGNGSLVTVAFQILVTPQVEAGLTLESVETVSTLVLATITRIRNALGFPDGSGS